MFLPSLTVLFSFSVLLFCFLREIRKYMACNNHADSNESKTAIVPRSLSGMFSSIASIIKIIMLITLSAVPTIFDSSSSGFLLLLAVFSSPSLCSLFCPSLRAGR
jgi:hypothetical protein